MKKFVYICILLILSSCSINLQVRNEKKYNLEKVEIAKDALMWVRSVEPVSRKMRLKAQYPQEGYYECRETMEISSTILCHFNNREEMGYALARASCFIEGSFCGQERGTVIGFNDSGFRAALLSINGFDLKSSDLIRFYEAVKQKCSVTKSDEYCFNHFEKKFFENNILPWSKVSPNYVLITFARFSGEPWYKSLVHEIMHAQYFQEPKYREIVEDYWKNKLKEKERVDIRAALSVAYDPKDEFLMINEFQAYILQSDSDDSTSLLYKFISPHRNALMKDLKEGGVSPIQVKIQVP